MAYLGNPEDEENQNQPGQPATQSGPAVAGGSGQAPGKGSGGVPQFTNIQAYLGAGNQSGASALQNTVGGAFDKEQKGFEDAYNPVYSKANDYRTKNALSQDDVSGFLGKAQNFETAGNDFYQTAGQAWNGQPIYQKQGVAQNQRQDPNLADYYKQAQDFGGRLKSSYNGPNSFAYGKGANFQNYGQGVSGGEPQFRNLMNSIYQSKSPMTPGASALQEQFDSADSSVGQTKDALSSRYGTLNKTIDDNTVGANQAAMDATNQYKTNQGLFHGLQTQSGVDQGLMNNTVDSYKQRQAALPASQFNFNQQGVGDTPVNFNQGNLRSLDSTRQEFNGIQDLLGLTGTKYGKESLPMDYGAYVDQTVPGELDPRVKNKLPGGTRIL